MKTEYRHFAAKPLSGSVGAVLEGIDISRDLDADEVAEIRQALLDHMVIFFRDQHLSDERLMTFGRCFGELYLHPNLAKKGPNPEVIHVVKEPDCCALDFNDGPNVRVKMSPLEMCEALGWEVPAPSSSSTAACHDKDFPEGSRPAQKRVRKPSARGKVKTATASVASNTGMSA